MARSCRILLAGLAIALPLLAADDAALKAVIERLERIEQENRELREELRQLKSKLDGGAAAPVEERLSVQEQRVAEHAQTKVESSERVPVRLTGMLLFNALSAGRNGAPAEFPEIALPRRGSRTIRGTMRQTSIGLQVDSPVSIFGAEATGEVMTDFYGEYDNYAVPRLRTAALDLQWRTRSVRVGIEKPIVAPRNPNSLAQIVYPALWGAGNLWIWQPQARIEQRFTSGRTDVRLQGGLFQTDETTQGTQPAPPGLMPRPGWQGRFQVGHRWDEGRVIEFAPGFHYSRSLALGQSVPSRLVTADWLIGPSPFWEFSGAFFSGVNAGPVGGLRQGVVIQPDGRLRAVSTIGGWGQLMLRPTPRLRIHAMIGEQDDRDRDLSRGAIGRNLSWALNGIVQLSPNVLLGLEAQQIRTTWIGRGTQVLNRYDLALAYLF